MTEIVVPSDVAAALTSANAPVRVVDPEGRLIAYATPTSSAVYFSEDEIEEARRIAVKAERGRPLSEILLRLDSLAGQ
jgi:hypothetical protein